MEEFEPETEPLSVVRRAVPTVRRVGEAGSPPRERLAAMIQRLAEQEHDETGGAGARELSGFGAEFSGGADGWDIEPVEDLLDDDEPRTTTWRGRVSSGPLMPRDRRNSDSTPRIHGPRSHAPSDHVSREPASGDRASRHRAAPDRRAGAPVRPVPARRAVVGVLVLAVLAVLVLMVFFPRGGDQGTSSSDGVLAPSPAAGSAVATASARSSASASSPTEVVVHVVGAVNRPGLRRLHPGAVVDDAVRACGGLRDDAAPEAVNLAAALQSGQQVVVPTRAQAAAGRIPGAAGNGTPGSGAASPGSTATAAAAGSSAGSAAGSSGSSSSGSSTGAGEQKVDLNTASATELETLPRVGPVLAQRIVDYRTQHGRFSAVEDLDAVPGIGPTMMSSLQPLVTV